MAAPTIVACSVVFAAPQHVAAQAEVKIQPGAAIVADGSECTLNWVFDGSGRRMDEVFVGTAAHCVSEVGQPVSLQAERLGEPLFAIGKVAFISEDHDYSLIRVSPKHLSLVDPSLKGHPQIPAGVSTDETASVGDVIQFSGHGVGSHATQPTRELRRGILHTIDDASWSALGPATSGDSGGPAANVTDGNKALGVVDHLCVTLGQGCNGVGGVTLETILDEAAAKGFPIGLRTVK